ncbi:coenzyme F420-0:L-glutamate ligase [Noviherbaspirillum sedimenti]|uniref:Coenzyme F420-0:L-glutamate ligase n=1 Tax=Noviherbaspirillum sedimenti TaxID=2320865 RepID=A0A3A3GQ03_9BURK|nr:coenzyme F420-0:L-glutamate ligase [Noviherbaspirillum sedimenti]RJG03080.1 coenzyme F420-0:L-glutamate ligase [Noviherbaspirillum sedimenti]
MTTLTLTALPGIPLVEPGADLAQLVMDAYGRAGLQPEDDDVLIVAQKIVSKVEGRYVYLNDVMPSAHAIELAPKVQKDPRLVEVILRESNEVLRYRPGVLIVEHKLGIVNANAGVDQSNIASGDSHPRVLLLPVDPDASARGLREAVGQRSGAVVAVIINDSAGRAWRNGIIGYTIGCAGIEPIRNMVGQPDLFGRELQITEIAIVDELAAAGSLLMGQAAEGAPVVLARGMHFRRSDQGARSLIRPKHQDLFRSSAPRPA